MAQGKNVASKTSTPGQKPAPIKQSASELVSLRNRFFYVYYRKLSLIFLGAIALCLLSLIAAFYFAGRKTPPIYLPTGPSGQLVETYDLDKPSNKDPEVMNAWVSQWAEEAARLAFSYDYKNFIEQVNMAQPYFTYRGWNKFMTELTSSQNYNTVQQQKMIVKFTPSSAPLIKGTTLIQGRLAWALDFTGTIEYVAHDGQHQGTRQNVLIKMVILRMSTIDSQKGLGIDQVTIQEVAAK